MPVCPCKEDHLALFGCDFDNCQNEFVGRCHNCFKSFCEQHFADTSQEKCVTCSGKSTKKEKRTRRKENGQHQSSFNTDEVVHSPQLVNVDEVEEIASCPPQSETPVQQDENEEVVMMQIDVEQQNEEEVQ